MLCVSTLFSLLIRVSFFLADMALVPASASASASAPALPLASVPVVVAAAAMADATMLIPASELVNRFFMIDAYDEKLLYFVNASLIEPFATMVPRTESHSRKYKGFNGIRFPNSRFGPRLQCNATCTNFNKKTGKNYITRCCWTGHRQSMMNHQLYHCRIIGSHKCNQCNLAHQSPLFWRMHDTNADATLYYCRATLQCNACGLYVIVSQLEQHISIECKAPCVYCHRQFPTIGLADHHNECEMRWTCDCGKAMHVHNREQHYQSCKLRTCCFRCQQWIFKTDLPAHQGMNYELNVCDFKKFCQENILPELAVSIDITDGPSASVPIRRQKRHELFYSLDLMQIILEYHAITGTCPSIPRCYDCELDMTDVAAYQAKLAASPAVQLYRSNILAVADNNGPLVSPTQKWKEEHFLICGAYENCETCFRRFKLDDLRQHLSTDPLCAYETVCTAVDLCTAGCMQYVTKYLLSRESKWRHYQSCPKRLFNCQFVGCNAVVPADELIDHVVNNCEYRLHTCNNCGDVRPVKYADSHHCLRDLLARVQHLETQYGVIDPLGFYVNLPEPAPVPLWLRLQN